MRRATAIVTLMQERHKDAFSTADVPALEAAQRGEPEALRQFYTVYQPLITRLCGRLLERPADIEDAAQNTFVRAFRALPDFRGQSSVKTWLYRIACNVCLDALRAQRRCPAPLRDDIAASPPALSQNDRLAAHQALNRLPPDQRAILALYYWENLTCEEIGAILQARLPTVKMRLFRARNAFRRCYEE